MVFRTTWILPGKVGKASQTRWHLNWDLKTSERSQRSWRVYKMYGVGLGMRRLRQRQRQKQQRKGLLCGIRGEELSCSPFPLIPLVCVPLPGLCSLALWLWSLFPWFLVFLLAPHQGLTCLPFSVFSSVDTSYLYSDAAYSLPLLRLLVSIPSFTLFRFLFLFFLLCLKRKQKFFRSTVNFAYKEQ